MVATLQDTPLATAVFLLFSFNFALIYLSNSTAVFCKEKGDVALRRSRMYAQKKSTRCVIHT